MITREQKMKKILIALLALLFLAVPTALAMTVEIKDISASSLNPVSINVGEVVPIKITHVAVENSTDVVIEAQLTYRGKKVNVESDPIKMIIGSTYTETLNLAVPQDIKVTSAGEYYTLSVTMKDGKGKELARSVFDVTVQRLSNELEVQKVITNYAAAGAPTLVTVVAKNTGSNDQEEVYVKVSIPELGLVAEEFMGDIAADNKGDGENVATVDIPLRIPNNVAKGDYLMTVEVYNSEMNVIDTAQISINSNILGKENFIEVVPTISVQEASPGATSVYTLRVANLEDKTQTYSVSVKGTDGWATYQVNPLDLTLASNSDQVITIGITPVSNALVGQHNFVVTVTSENAEKSISLVANVKEKTAGIDAMLVSVIVLAVVLVILVVVLVKTRKTNEGAEESYY